MRLSALFIASLTISIRLSVVDTTASGDMVSDDPAAPQDFCRQSAYRLVTPAVMLCAFGIMAVLWHWGPRSLYFEILRELKAKGAGARFTKAERGKFASVRLTRHNWPPFRPRGPTSGGAVSLWLIAWRPWRAQLSFVELPWFLRAIGLVEVAQG